VSAASTPVENERKSERPPIDVRVAVVSGGLLAAGAIALGRAFGWRQGALLAIGGALGYALKHAAFGFTGAYRDLLDKKRGGGVRAQMLMMAIAAVLFYPVLAHGSFLGAAVKANLGPVNVGVAAGAFIFGIGM
jgi:hypothetical protein